MDNNDAYCTDVLGPNGVGKSTIIDWLSTEGRKRSPNIKKTDNLEIAYISPHRAPEPGLIHKSVPVCRG